MGPKQTQVRARRPRSKGAKARDLGLPILDEADFVRLLESGSPDPA